MKSLFALIVSVILATNLFSQVPEKMSYQAIIRNSSNSLVTNAPVGMQISILQGSANGTVVYIETQQPTSDDNGLVSLEIGTGSVVSGTFPSIDWANGPYFIKTESDPLGGTNYSITGTSQLLSVPYALYAKTAGNSIPGPQGPAGNDGSDGANGIDGSNGKTILNGAVDPTAAEGTDGDFYINTATNEIFGPKNSGAWGNGTSLVGPQGSTGATGPTGPSGTLSLATSSEFFANRANVIGTTWVNMISITNSICFLTQTIVAGTERTTEDVGCRVEISSGMWRLGASVEGGNDPKALCKGRCLSW